MNLKVANSDVPIVFSFWCSNRMEESSLERIFHDEKREMRRIRMEDRVTRRSRSEKKTHICNI